MLMSAFSLRFKANYLEKMPQVFSVDSKSPFKDLLLPRDPNLVQKPLYLVGTVLNTQIIIIIIIIIITNFYSTKKSKAHYTQLAHSY